MQALWSTPGVMQESAPLVRTMEHTDINIKYSVRFWTEKGASPLETKDHFLSRLWYVAKRYDLKCELPTRKFIQSVEVGTNDRLLTQYQDEISNVPLLFKMGGNMLEYVAKGAILHEYAAGEYVIREGEMVSSLFVIVQGDGRALVSDRGGKSRQAFILKHGEFFGESSLFSGRPCPYSVVALNDLSVVLLDKEMVNRIVEQDTMMVKEIGRVISERRERIAEITMIH